MLLEKMLLRFRLLPLFLLLSATACVKSPSTYGGVDTTQPCSFVKEHDKYNVEDAYLDASRSFSTSDLYLIELADGIGPSTLGTELLKTLSDDQVRCLGMKLEADKEVILWLGADYELCKERTELTKKGESYATVFNRTMLAKMIDERMHECSVND